MLTSNHHVQVRISPYQYLPVPSPRSHKSPIASEFINVHIIQQFHFHCYHHQHPFGHSARFGRPHNCQSISSFFSAAGFRKDASQILEHFLTILVLWDHLFGSFSSSCAANCAWTSAGAVLPQASKISCSALKCWALENKAKFFAADNFLLSPLSLQLLSKLFQVCLVGS